MADSKPAARPLTPKQEAFCLAYVQMGTATDAYAKAYDAANMDARTIQKRSSELLAHAGVAARIEELRRAAAEKAIVDAAWVLRKLKQNVEVSLGERTIRIKVTKRDKDNGDISVEQVEVSAHDASAANKGLELLAKHLGLFEADNRQAGEAAAVVADQQMSMLELARLIAFRLEQGARVAQGLDPDDREKAAPVH